MVDIANAQSNFNYYQYSENGELIDVFSSALEAARKVTGPMANKAQSSRISDAANHFKSAYGFYWSKNKDVVPNCHRIMKGSQKQKDVEQYTLDGKYITTFLNCAEAERALGLSKGTVAKVCRGERNKTGGFKWKYREDI